VLLTFDEVTAMYHEFGHALHGMLSSVRYPTLAGTAVPRDFVEYPSQYNEMWAREPSVVAHYARHYQSGEPMPPSCSRRCWRAEVQPGLCHHRIPRCGTARSGWHQITPPRRQRRRGAAFEQAALRDSGLDYGPVRRAITRRTSRTFSRAVIRPATTLSVERGVGA